MHCISRALTWYKRKRIVQKLMPGDYYRKASRTSTDRARKGKREFNRCHRPRTSKRWEPPNTHNAHTHTSSSWVYLGDGRFYMSVNCVHTVHCINFEMKCYPMMRSSYGLDWTRPRSRFSSSIPLAVWVWVWHAQQCLCLSCQFIMKRKTIRLL